MNDLRSLYQYQFISKVTDVNRRDDLSGTFQFWLSVEANTSALQRQKCHYSSLFLLTLLLHRVVLLFSAQESENLELTSPHLSLTKALLVTH